MTNIGIIGGGKIGSVLHHMLSVDKTLNVTLADRDVRDNAVVVDATDPVELANFITGQNAIINAMPYTFNKLVAKACVDAGVSYFDFSEDVETTAYIKSIAESGALKPGVVMVPQCGLAPGAINIIGANLIRQFDEVKSLEMRVGALPRFANNEMKYYLSWSGAGLVNEYNNPCDALWRGQPVKTMPLDGLEHIVLDGVPYEAFNTSGGVATMCETYAGQIQDLDYKTIRYPGHCERMKFVMHDLGMSEHPEMLIKIMEHKVPSTDKDVVIIYVNAVGTIKGKTCQRSYLKHIHHDRGFTAIQRSTAAGMASVVTMWAQGQLTPGFVRQENISYSDFRRTDWGHAVYG